jgi:hypothetical protein
LDSSISQEYEFLQRDLLKAKLKVARPQHCQQNKDSRLVFKKADAYAFPAERSALAKPALCAYGGAKPYAPFGKASPTAMGG